MATHRVVKLFAVCVLGSTSAYASPGVQQPRTLGSGRPACGNVVGKGRRVACEPAPITAQQSEPAPTTAQQSVPAPITADQRARKPPVGAAPVARTDAIQPRVLASGRPACGNVVSKSDEGMTCATGKPVTPPRSAPVGVARR